MHSTSPVGGGDPARDPSCPRARSRRPGPQAGFSLIEVLIALSLAGVVVLGLAGGLLLLGRVDDDTAQRQRVEHALNNYAEVLRALDYRDCAATADNASIAAYGADYAASPLAWTPPADLVVEITGVRYWDASARRFVDTCAAVDGGAQELTVRASSRGRTATGQIVLGAR